MLLKQLTIMAINIERTAEDTFPMIILRDAVPFPSLPFSANLIDEKQVKNCKIAVEHEGFAVLAVALPETDNDDEIDSIDQINRVGALCRINSINVTDDGAAIEAEVYCRAELLECTFGRSCHVATVVCKAVQAADDSPLIMALREMIEGKLRVITEKIPRFPKEIINALKQANEAGQYADMVANSVLVRIQNKIAVLSEFDPERRLAVLGAAMDEEIGIIDCEIDIQRKTRGRIEENQRDYYLREQLKVIKGELGEDDYDDDELDDYYNEIMNSKIPERSRDKLLKEVNKLSKLAYASLESAIIRGYLDTVLELPWGVFSEEKLDVEAVRKALDRDHDGMDDVKNRILEYIAVRKLTPNIRNQIICLVGAPGVGKTSVASSVAGALGRSFVRVSLGGIHDESDIRGHRKTYVAAMPGRIINAINEAGTANPLILLDEIDKMTQSVHGDPASALLEVLDPDQNKSFRDHFIEIPFDLSDCMFIATANTLETVPKPLIDRMEIIEMKSYSRAEKLSIAKHHLIPKQLAKHGLSKRNLRISEKALYEIIDHYTAEAGVRSLEKRIAAICRKIAREVVKSGDKNLVCSVKTEDLNKYLNIPKMIDEKLSPVDEIGVVNGLAYTEAGGDMLKVEAISMRGTGKLELTGSLGDVMIESAKIALSLVRRKADQLGIDPDFYKTKDIHIHFPEGAVPKDGPSAGVTLVTALASELGGYSVHRDLAMTGEVTLRGKVLPIGGLREKTMAAFKSGIKTVIVPADNKQDVERLDDCIKDSLDFVYCESIDQVLDRALITAR